MPILNDEERHLVGSCYKKKGRDKAIELGHQLVCGTKKQSRVAGWRDFVVERPGTILYCFRGGLRSQMAQQWIEEETGQAVLRVEGGYKSFRNYLIDSLDPDRIPSVPIVVGGRTGSGKTLLLRQLDNCIDLEAIANHRGSAFGRYMTPQPRQVDFENQLAFELIRHAHQEKKHMVVEDEGAHIGRCYMPPKLANYFSGNLVLVKTHLQQRIQNIYEEYVVRSQNDYSKKYGGEDGLLHWFEDMNKGVDRIKKRLGNERMRRVKQLLQDAHDKRQKREKEELHSRWIQILLCEYYDPMYDYQLEKKNRSIIFSGDTAEVLEYIRALK